MLLSRSQSVRRSLAFDVVFCRLTRDSSQLEPLEGMSMYQCLADEQLVSLLGEHVDLLQHVQYESKDGHRRKPVTCGAQRSERQHPSGPARPYRRPRLCVSTLVVGICHSPDSLLSLSLSLRASNQP